MVVALARASKPLQLSGRNHGPKLENQAVNHPIPRRIHILERIVDEIFQVTGTLPSASNARN